MAMNWTNPSVLQFSQGSDPIQLVQQAAREVVLEAFEQGWSGPPFDPFDLASILKCRVVPSQEVRDAQLLPEGRGHRIDFNPNQPRRRIRFSIAHELAHTIFPDCREQVRQRVRRETIRDDLWQLEMLCNIAAGEFLMPAGNLSVESLARVSVDNLIDIQDSFDVSFEAVLLRVVRIERRNCAVFVASPFGDRYHLDYGVETHGAGFRFESGLVLPKNTHLANCTALGYTAKTDETWVKGQPLHIECVAIPGYPGRHEPRVGGIVYRKGERGERVSRIRFVTGDATEPHGEGHKVIAHVVNDGAKRWGGRGFANAVGKRWPAVQGDFSDWAERYRQSFRLGHSHSAKLNREIAIFSMIAQRGYGPSRLPRLRYQHLRTCLCDLREFAKSLDASVHMPRIGCGEAGGNWSVVQDLIVECLSDHGVDVTVYDLPGKSKRRRQPEQLAMFVDL